MLRKADAPMVKHLEQTVQPARTYLSGILIDQRKQRMVDCKLCGIEFAYEDYDMVLFHAWKYHPDVFESYRWDELRKIILVSILSEEEK